MLMSAVISSGDMASSVILKDRRYFILKNSLTCTIAYRGRVMHMIETRTILTFVPGPNTHLSVVSKGLCFMMLPVCIDLCQIDQVKAMVFEVLYPLFATDFPKREPSNSQSKLFSYF